MKKPIAFAIVFLLPIVGCAASQVVQPPPSLERRTLRISAEVPGFEYTWFECSNKFLGFCTETTQKKEFYNLSDKATRQKLIDMGFVARVLGAY